MPHVIEFAASGRARCRGCKGTIERDTLRFGERLPNPFADGEMTLWFHVLCAAYRRPESIHAVLQDYTDLLNGEIEALQAVIANGIEHPRLGRIAGIERAGSGRAKCRACRALIARDTWRIGLEFFEEGTFNPAGYIHLPCARSYFETNSETNSETKFESTDIASRLQHFNPGLSAADLADIAGAIG
jgi:hypothetical protein